jgi:hypothetical protein
LIRQFSIWNENAEPEDIYREIEGIINDGMNRCMNENEADE